MKPSSGQVLIEVIIAALVIIMVSLAITQLISTSLRGADTTMAEATATFLSGEIADAARAIAREDWHNMSNLATGSANTYYASTTGGKWITAAGTQNVSLNSITYNRYFYATDAYRSTSTGDIVLSGGYYDPSTVKININTAWNNSLGIGLTLSQAEYLSRYLNQTFAQTDWSGAPVGEVTTSVTTTTFATSSNIDVTSTVGSVQLSVQ